MQSRLYEGWIQHRRQTPVAHGFRFPLFMAYLDLSEIDERLPRPLARVGDAAGGRALRPARSFWRPGRPARRDRARAGGLALRALVRRGRSASSPTCATAATSSIRSASTTASIRPDTASRPSSPMSATRPGANATSTCWRRMGRGRHRRARLRWARSASACARPFMCRPSCRWTSTTTGAFRHRARAWRSTW